MNTEDPLATPDLVTALRRSWWAALAVMTVCGLLGALVASLIVPKPTATASLVVSDPAADSLFATAGSDPNYVPNQVALLRLRSTSERAIDSLPDTPARAELTPADVAEELEVDSAGDSGLITVSYSAASPERAQQVVNAVVAAYRDILQGRAEEARARSLASIDQAVATLEQQIAARGGAPVATGLVQTRDQLLQRRAELAIQSTGDGVVLVDEAALPPASRSLSPLVGALIGAALGMIPAAGLAHILALRTRTYSTRFDPEAIVGERLLSDVPVFSAERLPSDVPALDSPSSAAAEAFRFAATLLGIRQADTGSHVHAVVSASSQDGKTTVSANLAVTAAAAGRRVLAIDGDLDGRGLTFLLVGGSPTQRGLSDVVEGRSSLKDVVSSVKLPAGGQLDVLAGGSAQTGLGHLFGGPRLRTVLREAAETYDLVIVDVPSVLQVAYAAGLIRATDAAVVVVPHGSPEALVADLAERLDFLQVPTIGYLYNKAPLRAELGQHSRLVTDQRRQPDRGAKGPTGDGGSARSRAQEPERSTPRTREGRRGAPVPDRPTT